ncbi:aspartate aminotransferase family protein [Marinobacterium nitratireducens]|uniref:Aspartate aminotransferase family protein n=1 Tax=Marinobacterium nitratireducens TaxID=518897 RepID=A0A917ZQR3_9GAMM|nr:aspartate aminotransferase family protein [Marinobacterium nitratireducens]GGO88063.1 aspartate aminotransferase family protein [Marinobacterium nitratireducens]
MQSNAVTQTENLTAAIQRIDANHHWHPFTDTAALNSKGARVIVRGEGVYVWDSEGNRIIDGMAGLWCVNMGYGRKELIDAAKQQLDELPYYNHFFQTTTTPAAVLAQEIASVTPGDLNHIFFANSGSEAVDTLIRMIRHYWAVEGKPEKNVLIGRKNAYHGSTIGGTSLGGMGAMHKQGGPYLPNIEHIDQPYWYGEAGDLDEEAFGLKAARALEEKILEVGPEKVAAFIGEPIQGAGGVIVPPASYWPEIQRICRKYDILLAADEVICGFGRTGSWFGSQTFGIEPDLMSMAKGLSSGYMPISAVAVGDRVANCLIEKGGEFFHGFTYSGHPVAAAVAVANIRLMKQEKVVDYVADDIGPYFQQQLRAVLADQPLTGHIEGAGLVAGIALVKDREAKQFFADEGTVGTLCRDHCFENGLIMRAVGDRMVLSPPLVISRKEVDELCAKVRKCFDLTLDSVRTQGL